MKVDITLYAILGSEQAKNNSLGELAREAAEGGATIIQYRDKNQDTETMTKNTKEMLIALNGCGVPLVVNDRVDVAHEAGADGVHLGQDDMKPEDARKILGEDAIVGQSIKTKEDADNILGEAVDYVFVGGVYQTNSKHDATQIGVEGWEEIARHIRSKNPELPIGAIAGINADNMIPLWQKGADGIAMISEIFGGENPKQKCQEILRCIEEIRKATK